MFVSHPYSILQKIFLQKRLPRLGFVVEVLEKAVISEPLVFEALLVVAPGCSGFAECSLCGYAGRLNRDQRILERFRDYLEALLVQLHDFLCAWGRRACLILIHFDRRGNPEGMSASLSSIGVAVLKEGLGNNPPQQRSVYRLEGEWMHFARAGGRRKQGLSGEDSAILAESRRCRGASSRRVVSSA